MTLPSRQDWLFSAKAFLASMIALYVALAFDLPNPYWAMAAVYVVANPLSGATSSKAMYRALGTLLGAAASVFFVPLFVNAPEMLSLVVALWTGTLLYISMLDRSPRSYLFMLAGYSLPLIALPDMNNPSAIFDTALARSEEIIIGITCAAIVGGVILPSSIGPVLSARIAGLMKDAAAWVQEILRGHGAVPATPLGRQKLATDIAGLDMLIGQLSYDADAKDTLRPVRELRGRLLMLLPLLSSLADRLHALQLESGALPPAIEAVGNDIAAWIADGSANAADAAGFQAALTALEPPAAEMQAWQGLLVASAIARLREIVEIWQDCLTLQRDIAAGRSVSGWSAVYRRRQVVEDAGETAPGTSDRVARVIAGTNRYHDHGMLLFSAGSAVVATLLSCVFWIASGWSSGSGAVMMVAVACSFFAAFDRPAPLIHKFLVWAAISVVGSGIYLFGILPLVHDFEMVVLVFAVPFLIIGTLIPRPQFNMIAMLLTVNTASFVALQNRYGADFTSFINGGLAAVGGLLFAYVWTIVTRPFGAELAARRLVYSGWDDLTKTAAGRHRRDHARLAGRMLDRLGQLVPRLAGGEDRTLATIDGYAEVRIGFNILELQRDRHVLAADAGVAIDAVLAGVAALYSERVSQRRAVAPPPALQTALDHALHVVALDDRGDVTRSALQALVGVRRALYPLASAPENGAAALPILLAAE